MRFLLVHRLANTLAFERRCIRSRFVALLHHTQRYAQSRALLARRIDALCASSYLRNGTLAMTCRAVGVHPFFLVTRNAKLHFNRNMRPGKRKGHVIYIAVAVMAGDFSDRDVPSVGKIGMIGNPMYLNPRDFLIFLDVTDQFLFFFAVRHGLFMTVFLKFDIGYFGFLL